MYFKIKSYYMQLNGKIYNIETDLLAKLNIPKKTKDDAADNTEDNTENTEK